MYWLSPVVTEETKLFKSMTLAFCSDQSSASPLILLTHSHRHNGFSSPEHTLADIMFVILASI